MASTYLSNLPSPIIRHWLPQTPWFFSSSLFQRAKDQIKNPSRTTFYSKTEITFQDHEWKFITQYFESYKPTNRSISRVYCIYHPSHTRSFEASIVQQETQTQNAASCLDNQQQQIVERWKRLTAPYQPVVVPNELTGACAYTKVVPLWHGAKEAICQSICSSGFNACGKEFRFTTSAHDAVTTSNGGSLLLTWISMREPYSVSFDQEADQNYNAQYIPVNFNTPLFDKVVVFSSSQTLVRFWVQLQVDLLKSPVVVTIRHCVDRLLDALQKETRPQFSQVLRDKVAILINHNLSEPPAPSGQELYNWTLQLLSATDSEQLYVQRKLEILTASPEKKHQEAKRYQTGGDPVYAFWLYEELIKVGYGPAMVEAAFCLCHGIGTVIDLSRAAQLAQEALKKDLDSSQRGQALYIWGFACEQGYLEGEILVKEEAVAETKYQEAYSLGHLWGGVFLSRLYYKQNKSLQGEEVIQKLMPQLREQAQAGNRVAQTRLGFCYSEGQGVPKDAKQAIFWYQQATRQDDPVAQHNLGWCYEHGEGIPQDKSQAISLYGKAARQGFTKSQYNLGLGYLYGQGISKDKNQAAILFHKTAEKGFADGQCTLGGFYATEEGEKKDEAQAVFWLLKAKAQGHPDAEKCLGEADS